MYQAQFPDEDKPAVRWLPFQLNPDLPAEGISRKDYIERKFGPGGARNYARVAAIGKDVGIDFDFDAITVQPNTVNAHRLMLYGAQQGRENEVAESLFHAYFLEGAVITDATTLADVGERAGLERKALEAYLASDEGRDIVLNGDVEARRAGIGGVPFFIFNRRIAVSGAHEPETLLGAMVESRQAPTATTNPEGA
jgi:predicted DsbA family dithiol-disulfide isomerase